MWRQFAVLGLVLIAVALAIAVPLRSYLHQRNELARALAEQQQLETELDRLKARKAALSDPDYIKAEARRRLQYVSPGQTVYRIVLPDAAGSEERTGGDAGAAGSAAAGPGEGGSDAAQQDDPWYSRMWDTLSDDGADRTAERGSGEGR